MTFAVAARVAALVLLGDSLLYAPDADPDHYGRFAATLANHGVYGPHPEEPSAFRAPLYPVLLAPWSLGGRPAPEAVFAVHLLVALWTVAVTERLARRLYGPFAAGAAALLVAVDPILARQSTLIMSEPLSALLVASMVLFWVDAPSARTRPRRWTILTGILIGAGALARPATWALWGAILPSALLERRIKDWMFATVAAIAVCLPWGVRNQLVLGEPILTTTHGGYTLWLGQNPDYYAEVVAPGRAAWPPESFERWSEGTAKSVSGMNETARDRALVRMAVEWMREHPTSAAQTCARHWKNFWALAPGYGPGAARMAGALFYGVVYFLAAATLFRPGAFRSALPLWSVVLALSLVHAVYWSDARMRAPIEPVLCALAAGGADFLRQSRRRHSGGARL